METQLRLALDLSEFKLRFQPQFPVGGALPVRFEALIRWHPAHGAAICPAKFIPSAEKSGLIVPIGTWALREAIRRCADWQTGALKGVGVAVNVSASQLAQGDFAQIVVQALDSFGLAPKLLELELTESVFIKNVRIPIRTMEKLGSLGVTIALDDFGTGYSNLSSLRRLPIDAVKIDRSFLMDAEERQQGTAVMQCVLLLANTLGLRTICEGVETSAQLDLIGRLGCDEVQGFYLGRPSFEVEQFAAGNYTGSKVVPPAHPGIR
jgi:EAL domain-containing protein (putative c-di-GMP-specific phosphodiesterase class I)